MASPTNYIDSAALLKVVGFAPYSFTGCVRLLLSDHKAGLKEPGARSTYQLGRLIKSRTLLTCLYRFCRSYHDDWFGNKTTYTPDSLVARLEPLTVAALISLVFISRRCKRICNAEEWKFLDEMLRRNIDIAVRIGQKIPQIGISHALLAEGALHMALAAFSAERKGAFQKYRRYLNRARRRFDFDYELREFGCTSREFAVLLLTGFGFGSELGKALEESFNGGHTQTEGDGRRFRLYHLCADACQDLSSRRPALDGQVDSGVLAALDSMSAEIEHIVQNGSAVNWIDPEAVEASDLPGLKLQPEADEGAQITEGVIAPPASENEPATYIAADGREIKILTRYRDLPEDVRSQLPEDEFKQLQHMPMEEIVALFR